MLFPNDYNFTKKLKSYLMFLIDITGITEIVDVIIWEIIMIFTTSQNPTTIK